jgi:LuxR family maltose regulon positive regulatory protein
LQRAAHISDVLGCAITLADIRIAQGRLHDARRTYEQALQLAAEHGPAVLRGTADMHVGLSLLDRERDDVEAARQHVLASQQLGEHNGLPQNPYRLRVAMARIRETEGDLEGALELLDEAEGRYTSDFGPNVRPIAAMKARVFVRQGRLGEALAWARSQNLSAEDELSYVREFEHITLARLLLAQSSTPAALALLDRLLLAAEHGGRMGSAIEILLLQAITHTNMAELRLPWHHWNTR